MNGFQLQEHLIKAQSRVPVIFITGHDHARMEDEARALGVVACLRKPFDDQDLLRAIQQACEKMTTEA
jgi:FixJ family two-component response regulator